MKLSNLAPLIGIAIFVYIILNMELSEIAGIISNISVPLLLISIALMVPNVFLKALKWKLLIKSYGIDFPMKNSIKAWLVGFSVGLVTPGRLGDVTRAYYLKGRTSTGKSLTTVVVDRIIDIFVLFCLAIMGILTFITLYAGYENTMVSLALVFSLFLVSVTVFSKEKLVRGLLRPLFRIIIPEKYKNKIGVLFKDFYMGMDMLGKNKKILTFSIILSVTVWLVAVLEYYFLALSLGIDITYFTLLAIMPITVIVTIIPISFSGIGTRDAVLVFFFSIMALSAESAVSFALLILFTSYLLGFVGVFFWLKSPLRFKFSLKKGDKHFNVSYES